MSSKDIILEIGKKEDELKKLKELRLERICEYEREQDLGFRHSSYAIERDIEDVESDIEFVEGEIEDLKSLFETEILCEEEEYRSEFNEVKHILENHLDKKVKKH